MKLYTFHKVARPLTDYLNRHNYPFEFRSIGSVHALLIPFLACSWPKLRLMIEGCGLCYQFNEFGLLIF